MSKLIDKLQKISRGEVHRMGFGGVQATAPKIPALGLVASIPRPDADLVKTAAQGGADALLIQVDSLETELGNLEKAIQHAGDAPCGVTMETILPEDVDRLASAGADFLALHTETAPSAILRKESIGRVATIDPYLDDSLLRTLDRLAVDAILIELEQGNEQFLTVREVMACRHAIDVVRKPVMLRVSSKLSADDLANIRDLGIESVLIDLNSKSPVNTLSRLRKIVGELPPRRRPRENLDAILPQQRWAPKASEPEGDEP